MPSASLLPHMAYLIRGRGVLPEGLGYAVCSWIGASALEHLALVLVFSAPSARALRAALAMVPSSIPPIGIVGWAHPITAAGELLPGGAWLGLEGRLLSAYRYRPGGRCWPGAGGSRPDIAEGADRRA